VTLDRLTRITRFDRLSRLSRRRDALPPDIAAILALEPDVLLPLQYATLPGIGQVLWQDAARTEPVTAPGQAVGSALNIGSLGGYAEASGADRGLWQGVDGWQGDGISNFLALSLSTITAPFTHVVCIDDDGSTGIPLDNNGSSASSNAAFIQRQSSAIRGWHNSDAVTVAAPTAVGVAVCVAVFDVDRLTLSVQSDIYSESATQAFTWSPSRNSGIRVGSRRAGTNEYPRPIRWAASFPRALTPEETAVLLSQRGP
jgi:hypothetical protein